MGLLAGFIAYSQVKHEEQQVRARWDLVPALVVGKDLRPGETLDFKNLSSRSMPRRLVTSSVLRPESASYVVSQPVLMPLQAGDPLRMTAVEPPGDAVATQVAAECTRQYNTRPNASQVDASMEAIRARLAGAQTP
ncbi:SAF domain-containing protein [Corallococcus carmarthensis]|uniref:SAF domain-containing protein n=1 Tax=Corallococcus carmarthensis TaxID=2316728 RepID=UPI00148D0B9C|nr:SAF domain-containing protein [Corallococcus carmarthensis]NOK15548.1 hypothetical protein [Corallococcus carmarthensis]